MSEKATITAMREWLKTCPLIAEEQSENGAAFRISGLSPEPVAEFSIEDSPTDPVTAVFFSGRNLANFLNVRNPGALPVPFTAKLRSSGIVVDPAIRNSTTGEHIGFDTTLNKGDVLEIYRTTTDRLAVKLISGGVETNAFALLDEDSDLMELHPGDNVLTADAASGREGLQASISFYPLAVGILPEVMK